MSNSQRGRQPPETARKRPRPTRGKRFWPTYWPVVTIGALIAAALLGVFLYARSTPSASPSPGSNTSATVVNTITNLDLTQSTSVGSGGVANPFKATQGAQPLTGTSGHPAVLYIGAEWCPYCAAERWSLAIALSRFGTFSGLQLTQSSSSDVYPNTPTLTFANATYQSSTLDFQSVETADRNRQPLQTPTAAQQAVMQTYDPQGSIPFVDVGNRYYEVGAGYLPDVLQGMSWTQIAQALQNPNSPVAKQVLGNANWITAAICKSTNDSAGAACSATQIKTLEGQLS